VTGPTSSGVGRRGSGRCIFRDGHDHARSRTDHLTTAGAECQLRDFRHPDDLGQGSQRTPRERRRLYIALHLKLLFVVGIGLAWAGFSLWLSLSWIDALGASITLPLAVAVIFGIAIIPGYPNATLIASLLLDRPPPLRFDLGLPEATVVIACFNEEETIEETLDYVVAQDTYQLFMSPVSVAGYAQELFAAARRW
jgi:hypothetical protein